MVLGTKFKFFWKGRNLLLIFLMVWKNRAVNLDGPVLFFVGICLSISSTLLLVIDLVNFFNIMSS